MKDTVHLLLPEGIPIRYQLIRRKGQKHINIRVHHDGKVTVSAPLHASDERIKDAVLSKERWINRHVTATLERMNRVNELASIPIRGVMHSVAVEYDPDRKTWVKIDGTGKVITIRSSSKSSKNRRDSLACFLKRYGKKTIIPEVQVLAAETGIAVERVFIRDQKTRWGSSSARGNISLNWRIILLPVAVANYLILHELTHQLHMNHSREFWETLAKSCPQCIEYDRWLKENVYLLGLFR